MVPWTLRCRCPHPRFNKMPVGQRFVPSPCTTGMGPAETCSLQHGWHLRLVLCGRRRVSSWFAYQSRASVSAFEKVKVKVNVDSKEYVRQGLYVLYFIFVASAFAHVRIELFRRQRMASTWPLLQGSTTHWSTA